MLSSLWAGLGENPETLDVPGNAGGRTVFQPSAQGSVWIARGADEGLDEPCSPE